MNHRLTNVNDAKFILYEQLKVDELCQSERFADHSRETFDMIINAAKKLAVNDFSPANKEGDKAGCSWQDGLVKVPAAYHEPFHKYCEGGWINAPEDYSVGGQNVPLSVIYVCKEMLFAANHSLTGYMGLTHTAAKVIDLFGTESQKRRYMEPLYEGEFAGTMNLTEPQAGSEVGAVRTKTVKKEDGSYLISGGKIFITGGEQDLTRNIIHIMLARIEGDPEGTKGLSCFIVPKIKVREDGSLGDLNDIYCAGIEEKMGMKGSATCVMNYGENQSCIGELLGPGRQGIVVMFNMMNEQRVLVGLQGLAQGSTAYLHALQFAGERKQGVEFGKKSGEPVPIIRHPDVKRNLLWMKSYTEGMRALVLYTVYCMDKISIFEKEDEKKQLQDMVEILTPICKAYCTDRGFDVCVRAMQVHGGYGFCKEYLVEQFMRDCKVTSLYEGTNGIQAMDLFGRKINARNGEAFKNVLAEMRKKIGEAAAIDELSEYARELEAHVNALEKLTDYLRGQSKSESAYLSYSWATPYLEIFGDIVLGWMLLWQAEIAFKKLMESNQDAYFYKSKIITAEFYINSLLPAVSGKIAAVYKNDVSLLSMDDLLFS